MRLGRDFHSLRGGGGRPASSALRRIGLSLHRPRRRIADRVLGMERTVFYGGVVVMCGHSPGQPGIAQSRVPGRGEGARGSGGGREATHNPWALSLALWAYGTAFLDADPDRAREAMLRGVVITQDSGNRTIETYLASRLARLEAQHGDPLAALDYFLVSIRHLHDSGNSTTIRAVLAALAALFNRLGH